MERVIIKLVFAIALDLEFIRAIVVLVLQDMLAFLPVLQLFPVLMDARASGLATRLLAFASVMVQVYTIVIAVPVRATVLIIRRVACRYHAQTIAPTMGLVML